MTIGQRIRERRIALGLSVDEVAEMLHKNRATIYRYENGDIQGLPTNILEPLARILKTTPADLMGYTGEELQLTPTSDPIGINPELPSSKEKVLISKYRKMNDDNKLRLDVYADNLLKIQTAEDDILLAAHRERDFDQAAHDHDMELLKELETDS